MANERIIENLTAALASAGDKEERERILALIESYGKVAPVEVQQTKAGKYFYARKIETSEGVQYHALVGGTYPSNNPEDYKIIAYDSILELQDDCSITSLADAARRQGYNIDIFYAPEEVFDNLSAALVQHVATVFDAIGEGASAMHKAAALMGNDITIDEIVRDEVGKLMSSPVVAGIGLTADNTICEKPADFVEARDNYDDEKDEDDDEDYDEVEEDYDEDEE